MDQAALKTLAKESLEAGKTPAAIAQELDNGANAGEVAQALYAGTSLNALAVAKVLYAKDGLALSAADVAQALYAKDGLNLSAEAAAKALLDMGLSINQVAKALYAPDGLDLRAEEVAWALYGEDDSQHDDSQYDEIAGALYSPDGADVSGAGVAQALLGLADDSDPANQWPLPDEVARALHDGAGMSLIEIAQAMFGPRFQVDGVVELFSSYDGINAEAADIAQMLASPEPFNLSPAAVGRALGDVFDAEDVAQALHDGLGLDAQDVAQALKPSHEIQIRMVGGPHPATPPKPPSRDQDGPDIF